MAKHKSPITLKSGVLLSWKLTELAGNQWTCTVFVHPPEPEIGESSAGPLHVHHLKGYGTVDDAADAAVLHGAKWEQENYR